VSPGATARTDCRPSCRIAPSVGTNCGTPTRTRRYCSSKCRQAAYRERRDNRTEEQVRAVMDKAAAKIRRAGPCVK
jgi:hypothetical protein